MIELQTTEAGQAGPKRIEPSAQWVTTSGATMGSLRQHTTLTRIVPWQPIARRWHQPIRVETDPAICGLTVQPFEAIIGGVKSEAITVNLDLALSRAVSLQPTAAQHRRSTARSLLKHATGWAGCDLQERLTEVYETRSEASF